MCVYVLDTVFVCLWEQIIALVPLVFVCCEPPFLCSACSVFSVVMW